MPSLEDIKERINIRKEVSIIIDNQNKNLENDGETEIKENKLLVLLKKIKNTAKNKLNKLKENGKIKNSKFIKFFTNKKFLDKTIILKSLTNIKDKISNIFNLTNIKDRIMLPFKRFNKNNNDTLDDNIIEENNTTEDVIDDNIIEEDITTEDVIDDNIIEEDNKNENIVEDEKLKLEEESNTYTREMIESAVKTINNTDYDRYSRSLDSKIKLLKEKGLSTNDIGEVLKDGVRETFIAREELIRKNKERYEYLKNKYNNSNEGLTNLINKEIENNKVKMKVKS